MDQVVEFIHVHILVLCFIILLTVIVKIIAVINYKGFSLPAIFGSFFRMYNYRQRGDTLNEKRRAYMRLNNRINRFLYLCVVIFLIMLAIYRGDLFMANPAA